VSTQENSIDWDNIYFSLISVTGSFARK